MRTIACILAPFSLAAIACNSPTTGDQAALEFTPVNCGNPLLGCAFSRGIASGSIVDVQVRSTDGSSLDGVTLVAGSGAIAVAEADDVDGVPTWSLIGVVNGGATIVARDAAGADIDSFTFMVYTPQRLGLRKLAGEATGPTVETGVDEAWTVTAGQLVSFQALPYAGEYEMMGRLDFTLTAGAPLLDTEQSTSDPASGYLYVQPPVGDHALTFAIDGGTVALAAVLHARQ